MIKIMIYQKKEWGFGEEDRGRRLGIGQQIFTLDSKICQPVGTMFTTQITSCDVD